MAAQVPVVLQIGRALQSIRVLDERLAAAGKRGGESISASLAGAIRGIAGAGVLGTAAGAVVGSLRDDLSAGRRFDAGAAAFAGGVGIARLPGIGQLGGNVIADIAEATEAEQPDAIRKKARELAVKQAQDVAADRAQQGLSTFADEIRQMIDELEKVNFKMIDERVRVQEINRRMGPLQANQ